MSTFTISGVTKLDGTPAQARVLLFEKETGELRATTQSDAESGHYEFEATSAQQVGDPYWDNVALLCYFEGAAGSTSFQDETGKLSIFPNPTYSYTPVLQIADGGPFNNGYLALPATGGADLQVSRAQFPTIGTQDFCMEYWINPTNGGHGGFWPRHVQIGRNADASGVFNVTGWQTANPSKLHCQGRLNSNWYDLFNPNLNDAMPAALPNSTWSHVAIVRESGQFRCYINGTLITSYTPSPAYSIGNNGLYIAGDENIAIEKFLGGMGPLRLTIGVPRYTANFTPVRPQTGPLRYADPVMAAGEEYLLVCDYGDGVRPLAHGPIAPNVS